MITQRNKDPIHARYERLLDGGTKPTLAKLSLARMIAATVLRMWKDEEEYDPGTSQSAHRDARRLGQGSIGRVDEKATTRVRSREECSHATRCVAAEVSIHELHGRRPKSLQVRRISYAPSEEPNEAMADRGPDGRMVPTFPWRAHTPTNRDAMGLPSYESSDRAARRGSAAAPTEPRARTLNSRPPSQNGSRRQDRRICGDRGSLSCAPTLWKGVQEGFRVVTMGPSRPIDWSEDRAAGTRSLASQSTRSMSVEDQLAIQQAIAEYSYTFDSGDAKGWAELFTEDAVWEYFASGEIQASIRLQGRDELRKFALDRNQQRPEGVRSYHHQTGMAFDELTSDSARTRVMLILTVQGADESSARIPTTGVYHDRWTKTREGWAPRLPRAPCRILTGAPGGSRRARAAHGAADRDRGGRHGEPFRGASALRPLGRSRTKTGSSRRHS